MRVGLLVLVLLAVLPLSGGFAQEPLVPLSDMQVPYGSEPVGLYGAAGNNPPAFYVPVIAAARDAIKPLNALGEPDAAGKIGFLSIGMSNTSQEFNVFSRFVQNTPSTNPALVLVNGAQGGVDSILWAEQSAPWDEVANRLAEADLTAEQVQVIWLKAEVRNITDYASDYSAQKALRMEKLNAILALITARYPNVKLVYMSSRSYGGFEGDGQNTSTPEPLSYESGFAVRQIILDKIVREQSSSSVMPVVLWGPYLWAGEAPRSDGLFYVREDYQADAIHPSPDGQRKIAELMLDFFQNHPSSKKWFMRDE